MNVPFSIARRVASAVGVLGLAGALGLDAAQEAHADRQFVATGGTIF